MDRETKKRIRDALTVCFPRLWYLYERGKTYRTYRVVNDLTVYPRLVTPYDPAGTYVTMFAKPPRQYEKTLQVRTFDEAGIPLYQGKYYNLVQIAQYGLTEFGYYKSTGGPVHLERAKAVTRWLLDHQEADTGYWRNRFNYLHAASGYTLQNWACAMGQGQAASLLTRMWRLEGDEQYLDAAQKAFRMFDVPVSEGGLLARFDGHMVYEEYPTDPPSFTLNGMIFATFGLYDYLQVREDERVRRLFDEAVRTIDYMLPLYDDDVSSCYDLCHLTARRVPKVHGNKYHILHIALLQNLESVAPSPTLEYYIRKWARMSGYTIP